MRFTSALIGLAALALASPAAAQATLSPIAFSPEFQQELENDIGVREGEYLRREVTDAVNRAIARRGVTAQSPIAINISILDARPNKPTLDQLSARPGLDVHRSVSIGGAELRAVLVSSDGRELTQVDYRYYTPSISDLFVEPTTWSDARRAIRQFAARVADAYVAQASAQ